MKIESWDRNYLDDLVQLWNKELGAAFPMRHELFKQNSFNDINICWEGSKIVLDDGGSIIGFISVKRYQDILDIKMPNKTGWIQAIVVDSNFQQQGIGSNLLQQAETVLQEKGMEKILLGRDTYHYFPGVPHVCENAAKWFHSKGYEKQTTDHDLLNSYESGEVVISPFFDEVECKVLAENESDALLHFLHRCFPGRWEYEAVKYFESGGTGREFIVMKNQSEIIGFCRINDSKSPFIAQNVYWEPLFWGELGGIGPLGIDTAERGKGLGLAIIEKGIAELQNRGSSHIVIDWTGLVDFYRKLGYNVWKSYDSYQKSF